MESNETPSLGSAPAELLARLANDHVADIVEFLNGQPAATAATLIAELPPERAAEILDQPGLDSAPALVEALPDAESRCGAKRDVGRSTGRHIPAPRRRCPFSGGRASRRRVADRSRTAPCLSGKHGGEHHDDRVRQRAGRLDRRANAGPRPPGRAHARNHLRDLRARSEDRKALQCRLASAPDHRRAGCPHRLDSGPPRQPVCVSAT